MPKEIRPGRGNESGFVSCSAAEDLMQECYLRILKANLPETMDDAHRRHYLFRIGANLAKDRFRLMRREGKMPKPDLAVPDTTKSFVLRDLATRLLIIFACKTGNSCGSLTRKK
jgi:DNA-directed RNA polymerase specialized sigma24 family protein